MFSKNADLTRPETAGSWDFRDPKKLLIEGIFKLKKETLETVLQQYQQGGKIRPSKIGYNNPIWCRFSKNLTCLWGIHQTPSQSKFSEKQQQPISHLCFREAYNKEFTFMKAFLRAYGRVGGAKRFSSMIKPRIEGVKDVIAVASGKGGVGKSTTAVNLAVALAKKCQKNVGLLDADIYGPSIPTMMKIDREPDVTEDKKMIPIENYGVKCMSIGFIVGKDAPIVWRGPMVMNALEKMLRGVAWGNLDIIVVDMPPGTGDTQITISQNLQLSGAVIVSTPQDVALLDAHRGVKMFNKVEIPILGFVENMSFFKCPHCDEPSFIFGEGGTRKTADLMGYSLLGEIPIEVGIRQGSDEGVPIVIAAPDSAVSKAYSDIAENIANKLELLRKEEHFHPEINL